MARLIVAGGRDFKDRDLLFKTLNEVDEEIRVYEVVSGGARGADELGEVWAKSAEYSIKRFIPNWDIGKQAGYLRNCEMAEYAEYLVAFWDGKSKGTKHMIDTALSKGLWVKVVRYE